MAGHSHASNVAVRKNAQDKKRAGAFTKVAREITTAVRLSGPDPDSNPRLRLAILKGRAVDMPNDRIKRAIDLGMPGQDDGKVYEEARYEGYGPNGVAVIIEALTDNRTRTIGDLRVAFTKGGGNLGDSGAVSFMFDRVGEIVIANDKGSADAMFEAAVEAGAENVESNAEG
ncbi:MAG TPA: YebC/PmpR family DNA-binding transcriptional regulator, partial [Alphaproteobacteria bacterium]